MQTEILKIIEGGLDKNKEKVRSYATLLSEKLREEGDANFAKRISNLINKNSVHPVYLDEFMSKPVDNDTRIDMVDVSFSEDLKEKIILPEITKVKVDDFINSLKYRNKITELGINLPETLLLFGPPGCGKTSIAKYISTQAKLPLVTAKLDGLISSLLGNTAKNIRKIFDYAKERPCILFLDEFDAIAKARNDEHEVGELKRVVNSLLQNIDDFSQNNILIAATNHQNLLDPAVWRRFSSTIEIPKPGADEIVKLLNFYMNDFQHDLTKDSKKLKRVANIMDGLSPSDIRVICYNTIRSSIIKGIAEVTFPMLVYQVYLYRNYSNDEASLVNFLNESGVSQVDISIQLDISLRQVRKLLSNERSET